MVFYKFYMTEIRFYHLKTQRLEQALPQILSKALGTGKKIVLRAPDDKQAERLNEHLWTYASDSFLPHGTTKDGFAGQQPIWLTDKDENPNGAGILVLTGGTTSEALGDYDLCCEMLEDHDQDNIAAARARWKEYKEAGHDITYWQQTETGGWDKKA